MTRSILVVALVGLVACRDATGKQAPTAGSGSGSEHTTVGPSGQRIDTVAVTREDPLDDDLHKPKGDREDRGDWVPAEFKAGAARWKDTGVYLDGKPIGFLTFGELPIALKPTWVKEKVSANKRPHSNDLGWRWKEQRFYKFTDYLRSLGVDPKKVKEMHVYGMKFTQSVVVKAKDFASPLVENFMFRFGSAVAGKGIPAVPPGFANGKAPDKISSVMIYITKTPPTLDPEEGFMLDGHPVDGVPYYGEPPRGGVRIYLDDKLAATIKRQELDPTLATTTPDGEQHWNLYAFLKAKGVDPSHIVEAWTIRDDLRRERISAAELPSLTFTASSKAKGGVSLGDQKLGANVIALHTRVLKPDELPVVTDDEQ